jgi:hypothetical protein
VLPRVPAHGHSGKRFSKKTNFSPECCTRGRVKKIRETALNLHRGGAWHSGKASPSMHEIWHSRKASSPWAASPVGRSRVFWGSSPSAFDTRGRGLLPQCAWLHDRWSSITSNNWGVFIYVHILKSYYIICQEMIYNLERGSINKMPGLYLRIKVTNPCMRGLKDDTGHTTSCTSGIREEENRCARAIKI